MAFMKEVFGSISSKVLLALAIIMIVVLQYRFWFGEGAISLIRL